MFKPILTFLAPVGATLMLLFSSLTTYRILIHFAGLTESEGQAADVTALAPIGACGAVLFGMGMMNLTLLRRRPTLFARGLLLIAALALVAGAALIGYGDWRLHTAFSTMATSESVAVERFVAMIEEAKIPLLTGYSVVLIGSGLAAWAAGKMTEKSLPSRSAFLLAAVSLVLLAIAIFWGNASARAYATISEHPPIKPAIAAKSITGAIQSVLVALLSIFGFGLATLIVALPRRRKSA